MENNEKNETLYKSYTKEWYEEIVKKDPELLKWFNENVMIAEYYDIDE